MIILTIFFGISYISIENNKKILDTQLASAALKNDKLSVKSTIQQLEQLTPYEEFELVKWSSAQESIGNNSEAIRLLEKLSVYSPRWYLLYLPHQLDLQKKQKIDLKKYLESRKKIFSTFPYSNEEKAKLNDICNDYAKMKCIN